MSNHKNQIIPDVPWTLDIYKARINTVDKEIAEACQEMNKIHSQINALKDRKIHLQTRISKKSKYKALLMENIMDIIPNIEDPQWERNRIERERQLKEKEEKDNLEHNI